MQRPGLKPTAKSPEAGLWANGKTSYTTGTIEPGSGLHAKVNSLKSLGSIKDANIDVCSKFSHPTEWIKDPIGIMETTLLCLTGPVMVIRWNLHAQVEVLCKNTQDPEHHIGILYIPPRTT